MSFNPFNSSGEHNRDQSGILPDVALEDTMDTEAAHSYSNPTHVGDNAYPPVEARHPDQPSSAAEPERPTMAPVSSTGPPGQTPMDLGAMIAAIASNPEALEQLRMLVGDRLSVPLDPRSRFEVPQAQPRRNPEFTPHASSNDSVPTPESPPSHVGGNLGPSQDQVRRAEEAYAVAIRTQQEYAARITDLEGRLQQAESRHPRMGQIRIRSLSSYSGQIRGDACDHWTLEAQSWVYTVETVVLHRDMTENEKIAAVGSYTTEKAHVLWLYWTKRRTEGDPEAPSTLYGFLLLLRKHFTPPDAPVRRRRRFDTMRQTGTALEFIFRLMDMRTLLEPIPTDSEMIRRIFNGLKDAVRLRVHEFPQPPTRLVDYQAFVIRVDESIYHAQRNSGYRSLGGSLNAITQEEESSEPTMDVVRYEEEDAEDQFLGYDDEYNDGSLNAVHAQRRHFKPRGRGSGRGQPARGRFRGRVSSTGPSNRSSNDNWNHRKDIICYRCGEEGHIARNCPAEKVKGQ